jgi:hypothetical protein
MQRGPPRTSISPATSGELGAWREPEGHEAPGLPAKALILLGVDPGGLPRTGLYHHRQHHRGRRAPAGHAGTSRATIPAAKPGNQVGAADRSEAARLHARAAYAKPMLTVEIARQKAEQNLALTLPRRWRHVQGVGSCAERIASADGDEDGTLAMAAWCHDIGYAPELVLTGFHPLDGASYLRRIGASDRVVSLVAHHSFAALEASLRGMQAEMANYTDEQGSIRDALWYCDLTTSPDGQPVSASERIAEIKQGTVPTTWLPVSSPALRPSC